MFRILIDGAVFSVLHIKMTTPGSLIGASPQRHRVAIIDDHDFFAACLRALLDSEDDLMVCDIASRGEELGERLREVRPDLLVIDLSLGGQSGLELARRLRGEFDLAIPILFTSSMARPSSEEIAGISRCAFVHKSRRPVQFLAALREVLRPVAEGPAAFSLTPSRAEV